jgi:hypothetical protein
MEQKTRWELACLISSRVGVRPTEVSVYRSKGLGWDAMLITTPPQAFRAAEMVRNIAAELRARYELND